MLRILYCTCFVKLPSNFVCSGLWGNMNAMDSTIPANSTIPSSATPSATCPEPVSISRHVLAPNAPNTGAMMFRVYGHDNKVIQIVKEPGGCGDSHSGEESRMYAGWGADWEYVHRDFETSVSERGFLATINPWRLQPTPASSQYVFDGTTTVTRTGSGGFPPYHFSSTNPGVTVDSSSGSVTVSSSAASSLSVSNEDIATDLSKWE